MSEIKNISVWGVEFSDTSLLDSGCISAIQAAEKGTNIWVNVEGKPFSENREVLEILGNYMLIAYMDAAERVNDQEAFSKITQVDESILPLIKGTFDHQGKYYLILHADVQMGDVTNTLLYRNVIVNPQAYLKMKDIETETRSRAKELLP